MNKIRIYYVLVLKRVNFADKYDILVTKSNSAVTNGAVTSN